MTISNTSVAVSYTGNGATTSFSVTFPFFDEDEIEVIERTVADGTETVKTLTSHYTVTGGAGSTGTVEAVSAPSSAYQWHIRRKTGKVQETDYVENDAFPAASHELALDRLVALTQELGTDIRRGILQPKTDVAADLVLPTVADRASKVLAFDANGLPVVSTSDLADFETYADDAAASAAAAAVSESNAATSASNASTSESNASTSASNASTSASNASTSASNASTSESNASTSATAAAASAAQAADAIAAAGMQYLFSASTTASDPGAGYFRLNNATLSSVTAIYVDNLDNLGVDVSSWLDNFDASSNPTTKGVLTIRGIDSTECWLSVDVTAVADSTGYRTLTAAYIGGSGTWSADEKFLVTYAAAGDQGSAGPGSGDLLAANNLSDVASAATARTNLGLGTGDGPQFATIELGNASDTTLARDSAGVVSVEGDPIATVGNANSWSAAQTFNASYNLFYTTADYGVPLIVTSVSDTAGGGQIFFHHDRASPANNDVVGQIAFRGNNSAAAALNYATIGGQIIDQTSTSEDGRLVLKTVIAGSNANRVLVGAGLYTASATGGDQGVDTINAANYFKNGTNIFTAPTITGTIIEDVYAWASTSGSVTTELEPANGSIQTVTLTGNITALTDNIAAGECITLMIDDGTAYTITWPTITWRNNGGSAPTLATSGYTVVVLWKVSTTLYGVLVGDGT